MKPIDRENGPVPRLVSVATAVPAHVLRQDEVARFAKILFGASDEADIERLLPAFANAGIETRHSCVPLDWYRVPRGWAEKNRLYIENAVQLAADAALDALAQAGLGIEDIDTVVAVSTSGIATPSLDALLVERLRMRRDVERMPIFGLGCAGGVLGLTRAASLARAAPRSKVLFVVVELCGLTFRHADRSKSNVIATVLFGDGAAACVLACDGAGPGILRGGEYTWPDSLDVMGWRVADDGFGVLFSRDIPTLVRRDLRAAADDFLARAGLTVGDLSGLICHPGGAKVLDALEEAFDLAPGSMVDAREVLARYGNMSAATVMFVLARAMERGLDGRYLMSALGPGFTAAFLALGTA
ncbi:MAG: 3-oxoacyl-[acyl-carrier-protein] synthase III C-terminal domain-containing protein [Alphaproteobacteria bacterium]